MSNRDLGIFGIGQGLMPKGGPLALRYTLDLTNGPVNFDITERVMNDDIDFIQSVAIDNTSNSSELILVFGVTGHRIVCPRLSQGFFGVVAPTGPIQIRAVGPSAVFNLLFMNMPFAPSIYTVPQAVPLNQ